MVVVRFGNDSLGQECVALLAECKLGELAVELDGEYELVERVHTLRLQYGDPRSLALENVGEFCSEWSN